MIRVVKEIAEWKKIRAELKDKRIGLIPTMGYLHEGHVSLVRRAASTSDVVVMSVFVNPLQFGPNEDFERYPRDLDRDRAMAQQAGVDYLFAPSVEEMYPSVPKTTVHVGGITEKLCGASRPGHFDGVGTVVSKLFHIIEPDQAFFGQKDAQQVAVIKQMVQDLHFPVKVITCPTLRESDGLAMSSRNVYLNEQEREQAVVLYRALQWAKLQVESGETDVQALQKGMEDLIHSKSLAQIDYVKIYQYPGLEEIERLGDSVVFALAVRFGKTRLIDNMIVEGDNMIVEGCSKEATFYV